jgi:hypothetical protein
MIWMPNIWRFLPTKYGETKQMSKVNFQPPISGKDLKLPDLPPEEQPASDPLPKITHAKSEQKAHNAQKNCIKTTKNMSTDASRQRVTSHSEKKSSFKLFGKALIKNIKDSFQHHHAFSKAGNKKQSLSRADAPVTEEHKSPSRADWLESGLKKSPLAKKLLKASLSRFKTKKNC